MVSPCFVLPEATEMSFSSTSAWQDVTTHWANTHPRSEPARWAVGGGGGGGGGGAPPGLGNT